MKSSGKLLAALAIAFGGGAMSTAHAAAGGEAGQPRTPEPPAESKPGARFSFSKEPAWKRKRSGSDGAP